MADFNMTLTIGGVETAVASVEDLEKALKGAKDEMKTLQIGSEGFNVAANNVQKLDSELKNIKLRTEGINTKQMAQSFAKLGETVTGSFAIATNAMAVFGVKSEQVAAAEQKAQSAIAVVLGARAIAEGIVEGRLAARLILEKVSIANQAIITTLFGSEAVALSAVAVASGEATAAQWLLNAAMDANPIGLLIIAVGGLIAAFSLLGSAEDDEIERRARMIELEKKFSEQLEKTVTVIKERLQLSVDQSQRELELMKSRGESQDKITLKEKEVADKQIWILNYVDGFRGTLNAKELKEKKDLENKKLIIDAEAAQTKIKITKEALKDYTDKLKGFEEESTKAILELRKEQALTSQEIRQLDFDSQVQYEKKKYEELVKAANRIGADTTKIDEDFKVLKENIRKKFDDQQSKENEAQLSEERIRQIKNFNDTNAFYRKINDDRAKLHIESLKGQEKIDEQHGEISHQLDIKYAALKKEGLILISGDAEAEKALEVQLEKDKNAELTAEEKRYQDAKKKQRDSDNMAIVNQINMYARQAISLASQANDIENEVVATHRQDREQEFNAQYSHEENLLRNSLLRGQITKEQYDQAELVLKARQHEARLALDKKAFEEDKKARLHAVILSTLTGVGNAFMSAMSLPYPANFIVGGISAAIANAFGVVQYEKIKGEQFNAGAEDLIDISSVGGSGAAGGVAQINAASSGGFTSFAPGVAGSPGTGGSQTVTPEQRTPNIWVSVQEINKAQNSVNVSEGNATF